MKTILVIVLALILTTVRSQNVSLHFQYAPLDSIVASIQQQTGLKYTAVLEGKKVDSMSVFVIDRSLSEALYILFKDKPYHFEVYTNFFAIRNLKRGETVVPARADVDPEAKGILGPPPADVTGTLIDASGKPVEGAIVQMMQSNVITKSDKTGKYLLPNVPVEGGFEITHPQYQTQRYFNIGQTELKPIVMKKK